MSDPKERRWWRSCLVVVLLIAAAILVIRFLGRPPAVGVPVGGVIEEYGLPYYDSRAERGDGPGSYVLFFSAHNALGPRALYVRVDDDRVAESWFWSK